jgi:phytoene synthase
MSTLVADHAACAAVLARSGSSFALPIRLLPEAKRRGTTALYAFCRLADDIVDDAADPAAARVALEAFAADLSAALAGNGSSEPVIRAVVDTARRHAVPPQSLVDILDGVRMDLDRSSYESFADLEGYCSRVAGAVGIASIHVWGFRQPRETLPAAHACGLAFQLTNILRDIPEDLARGRIYLPLADLRDCGCDPDDLHAGRIGPEFARLAAVSADRAEDAFRRAETLDRTLSTDGRIVFRAMLGGYRTMFAAVRRAGTGIFTSRVRPRGPRLAAAALATVLAGPWLVRPWLARPRLATPWTSPGSRHPARNVARRSVSP